MSLFGDITSGLSALTKPISDIYDIYANEKNFDFQQDQYNYQKNLQQQIFNREDTAVRRRAADLKAAGFNPLLAAGGAASSGQAVTVSAPQRGLVNPSTADYMIAKAKADVDISMTKAQQELLNEQKTGVGLENELKRKTIQWYDDHPNFAPGVETGIYTGKGATSIYDAFVNGVASSRLGSWAGQAGEAFAHATKQKPNPQYETVYKYYRKTGLSHDEADRRAKKFIAKYKEA